MYPYVARALINGRIIITAFVTITTTVAGKLPGT